MDKKSLTEADIRTKFVTPAIVGMNVPSPVAWYCHGGKHPSPCWERCGNSDDGGVERLLCEAIRH